MLDKLYKRDILYLKGDEGVKKGVYSITLRDDVVRELDRAAYLAGATRSGMINRLLAESLGLATPEKRKVNIFSELARHIAEDGNFLVRSGENDSQFAVRGSIRFKYNPSIQYSVAVYPEIGEYFGELRVNLRTQNSSLIACLDEFFALWCEIERRLLGLREASFGGGRYVRRLRNTGGSAECLGEAAAGYIRALHSAISLYFAALGEPELAAERTAKIFRNYLTEEKSYV